METIQVLPIRVRVTAILRKALLSGEYRPGELAALQQWAMEGHIRRSMRNILLRFRQSREAAEEKGV